MINSITNLRVINNNFWIAGQPNENEIAGLRDLNFDTIINLAPTDPRYSLADEAGLVKSLGMEYLHQPINFSSPSIKDFEVFEKTLSAYKNRKVFIHCAANYRVTVIFGFYAVKNLGWTLDQYHDLIYDVWDIDKHPIWLDFKNELIRNQKNNLKQQDLQDDLRITLYNIIASFILRGSDDKLEHEGKPYLLSKLDKFIKNGDPIKFILPGFPCKSPNSFEKSFGTLPDYGETLAIQKIDLLGNLINQHYQPGSLITILSDGTTFNDIVGVSDEERSKYNKLLRSLCRTENIRWAGLEDIFPNTTNPEEIREALFEHAQLPQKTLEEFIQSVQACKVLSAAHDKLCGYLYNDFRMLKKPELSKDSYLNAISLNAYQMMFRGKALTANISRAFPDDIRLSTHQYDNSGPKFTFKLADNIDAGAPWHTVPVCYLDGRTFSHPHGRVDPSRHLMVTYEGHPWLYHETDSDVATQFEYKLVKRPHFGLIISNPKNLDLALLSPKLLSALMHKFGFVCIKNFHFSDADKLTQYCRSFGEIYLWDFGAVHIVKPEDDPHGFVHSLEKTPIHWDLSMLPLTHASVQRDELFCASKFMLYCNTPPHPGEGQTTIVDGRNVLRLAGSRKIKTWAKTNVIYSTKKTYFGGHPRTYSLIQEHPHTGEMLFRYQEGSDSDLQKFSVNIQGVSPHEEKAIIDDVNNMIYSDECMIAHEWEKDDLLLVDNYLMLHGRLPMTEKSKNRELWRVQTCNSPEITNTLKDSPTTAAICE